METDGRQLLREARGLAAARQPAAEEVSPQESLEQALLSNHETLRLAPAPAEAGFWLVLLGDRVLYGPALRELAGYKIRSLQEWREAVWALEQPK